MNKQAASHVFTAGQETNRHIDSKMLLGTEGRVVILHQGQHYILRQTQAGKLILTK